MNFTNTTDIKGDQPSEIVALQRGRVLGMRSYRRGSPRRH